MDRLLHPRNSRDNWEILFQQINETLASFFARIAPSPIETDLVSEASSGGSPFPDTVKIRAGKTRSFDIGFMRTIRVPDDGKVHNLPPELGRFPLFNIASFQDRLPQDMVNKGGIFLPIYRKSQDFQGADKSRRHIIK
jgi:hypothetical protein